MALTVYSNCSVITTGCFLYTDTGLTTPASNGKYSDGANCFTVSGGAGEITASEACPATTTTTTAVPTTTTTTTAEPTTTTTTTEEPTTTTTTTEGLIYYLADKYECTGCTLDTASVLVTLPSSFSLVTGRYYVPVGFPTGFVYLISSGTTQSPAAATDLLSIHYATCTFGCAHV